MHRSGGQITAAKMAAARSFASAAYAQDDGPTKCINSRHRLPACDSCPGLLLCLSSRAADESTRSDLPGGAEQPRRLSLCKSSAEFLKCGRHASHRGELGTVHRKMDLTKTNADRRP